MKKIKKAVMSLLLVLGMMIVGTTNSAAGQIGWSWSKDGQTVWCWKDNDGDVWILLADHLSGDWGLFGPYKHGEKCDFDGDPVYDSGQDSRFTHGMSNCLPKLPTATNATNIAVGSSNSLGMQSMNGSNAELLNRSFELDNEENNDW